MDALEKASFKALHGAAQAQRTLYANQPPLPLLSDASQHRAGASPARRITARAAAQAPDGARRRSDPRATTRRRSAPRRRQRRQRSTGRLRRPTAS